MGAQSLATLRQGPPTVAGRWHLVADRDLDPTRRAAALADSLLERHGVVTRGAVAAEGQPGGFSAVYPVLAGLEERGAARRGYFVEGLGAAQFALPGAVDRLRSMSDGARPNSVPETDRAAANGFGAARNGLGRPGDGRPGLPDDSASGGPGASTGFGGGPGGSSGPGASAGPGDGAGGSSGSGSGPDSQRSEIGGVPADWLTPSNPSAPSAQAPAAKAVVLAATDPASPYGAALEWPSETRSEGGHRPGRKAGALVVLVNGDLTLYVERGGKTFLTFSGDQTCLAVAAKALAQSVRAGALGTLSVERADGEAIQDSTLAEALSAAGFTVTPRGLRLRA